MQKLDKFAEAGAIHGVKYILGANHPRLTRLFWTISVVLSICGFFFYLHSAWLKITIDPEILIKNNERMISEFPWPTITVCSNIFAKSELASFAKTRLLEKHTDNECKIMLANLHWCNPIVVSEVSKMCPENILKNEDIVETIYRSSLQTDEIFMRGHPNLFEVTSGLGPCYTFNTLSYSQQFHTENIHSDYEL
jgi:hypothetical protein